MINPILPIPGVPDELLRTLNDRFRSIPGSSGAPEASDPPGLFFTSQKIPDANGTAIGTFGVETDTGILYQVQTVGSKQAWVIIGGGTHVSTVASSGLTPLTTGYQTVGNLAVTLTRKGWWNVQIAVNVLMDKNDTWVNISPQLSTAGAPQTDVIQIATLGTINQGLHVSKTWPIYAAVGTETVTVKAKRLGGTGNSIVSVSVGTGNVGGLISATWLHP